MPCYVEMVSRQRMQWRSDALVLPIMEPARRLRRGDFDPKRWTNANERTRRRQTLTALSWHRFKFQMLDQPLVNLLPNRSSSRA